MTKHRPKFLYHYTSIETLALILKNKCIRFRRLDLMDDPNEAISGDIGRQGKYVMVSCWTSSSKEELLIWSLYTKDLRGVRIKLPTIPFEKKYNITQSDLPILVNNPGKSYIQAKHIYNDQYSIPGIDFESYLKKVKYTDDENLLHPKVMSTINNGTAIILSRLGEYKRNIWSKQKEWRYTFPIFPMTREMIRIKNQPDGTSKFGALMLEAMLREQEPGIQFLDIPILEQYIKSIEITLGPRVLESDRTIVTALKEQFAMNAKIRESKLVNMIN